MISVAEFLATSAGTFFCFWTPLNFDIFFDNSFSEKTVFVQVSHLLGYILVYQLTKICPGVPVNEMTLVNWVIAWQLDNLVNNECFDNKMPALVDGQAVWVNLAGWIFWIIWVIWASWVVWVIQFSWIIWISCVIWASWVIWISWVF